MKTQAHTYRAEVKHERADPELGYGSVNGKVPLHFSKYLLQDRVV